MEFRGDRTALLDKMWAASNALARVQASAPIEGRPSPATAVEREELSRRLQRDRQVEPGRCHVQSAGAVEGAALPVEQAAVDGESRHVRCG